MGKIAAKNDDDRLRYDWVGDLIAIFLAAIVCASFVLAGIYWTDSQLGG